MEDEFVWTDGIESALREIERKSMNKSERHKNNYYYFKGYQKYFRVPTIVLSGMNSVFSVGLQPYVSQGVISILCCSISLMCGVMASIELFLGIQDMMEKELVASKDYYILSSDIFKTLAVERNRRLFSGITYLDNIHAKYCHLIEQCNLLENTEKLSFMKSITDSEIELKNFFNKFSKAQQLSREPQKLIDNRVTFN